MVKGEARIVCNNEGGITCNVHVCASHEKYFLFHPLKQVKGAKSGMLAERPPPFQTNRRPASWSSLVSGVLHGVDEQHGVCCAFPLQTAATATVGPASVTKAGSERPASSRRSVNYPARRAKSCAGTHRGWCAPTEVPRPQRTHKQTHTDTPHSSEKRALEC